MAAYFHHGSAETQAASMSNDGVQTLYLMSPNIYFSDTPMTTSHNPPPPNMLFFNPDASTMNLPLIQPNPNHHHQLLGIPISVPADHPRMAAGLQYSAIWPGGPGHMDVDHNSGVVGDRHSGGDHKGFISPQLGFLRPTAVASLAPATATVSRGLSLSLSTQQVVRAQAHDCQRVPYHEVNQEVKSIKENSGSSPSSASNAAFGASAGSKYLRAAQELLDEVINVGRGIKGELTKGDATRDKMTLAGECETGDESSGGSGGGGDGGRGGQCSDQREADQLSTARRQELHMKKAKLVNMLDAVEQRYQQYSHQMQQVVSSFEQAAGFGAARSYTALALRTISKQFRCLKDAISMQIKSTIKGLGEEENNCLGVKVEAGSGLRYVDHRLRQQRALQHLGMGQPHNAWRPQRGLPERAVSVLRAWLFEHFLHPYPKDSDKLMLAKQSGLTRSQVSNWFINARVRLWKPMVEEMYTEEIKEKEENDSNQLDNSIKKQSKASPSKYSHPINKMDHQPIIKPLIPQNPSPSKYSNNPTISMCPMHNRFSLVGIEGFGQRSPKKQRISTINVVGDHDHHMKSSPISIVSMDMELKQGETHRQMINANGSFGLVAGSASNGGGYGAFPMGDLGRFHLEQFASRLNGNGVSLSLGLPHCEQSFLPNQDIRLGRGMEMGAGGPAGFGGISPSDDSDSDRGFEGIEIPNAKRFAAQLLPDFVA